MPQPSDGRSMSRKSKTSAVLDPVSLDALDNWARTVRKNPTRRPLTDSTAYQEAGFPQAIRRACEHRAAGLPITVPGLLSRLKQHGYGPDESALRKYIRKHLQFDWKARRWLPPESAPPA
jgi:hypothetical protein